MATKVLSEAERMRRVPGIIFVDGATGRRARIAGTGIEVFEVVKRYRATRDWADTREFHDMLSDAEFAAARAYYEAFPEEIDAWLDDADRIDAWLEQHAPLIPPYRDGYGTA
ncbi:MAG TPA: hypothetical protein VKV26_23005 [Dehalococcoidia bacterium]|nr:hypothetical protein [Dehalococcoidia bacterium]